MLQEAAGSCANCHSKFRYFCQSLKSQIMLPMKSVKSQICNLRNHLGHCRTPITTDDFYRLLGLLTLLAETHTEQTTGS